MHQDPDLLPKDRTILERPIMEFRPFGVDTDGGKIRDVSGTTVQANVECLEEIIGKAKGAEAGRQAVEKLVQLLNERIPDPTYHVTADFLRSVWNSYSYEFVMFLAEFCEVLTGDPHFQYHVGQKFISPLIQTLGRPFTVSQIYRMFPHFGDKFVKGSVLYGPATVTDRSAVLSMKFTDRIYREFGPYRKACTSLICECVRSSLSSVPERVHHLAPATVRDLTCIADGAEYCSWEFGWSPRARHGFLGVAKDLLSGRTTPEESTEEARAGEVILRESPASLQRSAANGGGAAGGTAPAPTEGTAASATPLSEVSLLPVTRTILERPQMLFPPFGKDEQGKKIQDVGGVIVRANVDQLEETVSRVKGAAAGAHAVESLCRLLNERIPDRAYHVTPQFLKNIWNGYSYEFVCYLREFCQELSGDRDFHFHVGQGRHLSPMIQILGRPFPMSQIYKLWPHFAQKFAKGSVVCEVGPVTDRSAILRLKFSDRSYRQFGPYRKACAKMVCDASKGGLMMVPQRVHYLSPAAITDRTCIVNGDEWCEWEITWSPQPRSFAPWPLWGVLAGGAVFGYLRLAYPGMALPEALVIAGAPAVLAWLSTSRRLQRHAQAREALIQEQVQFVEARHEELREVYLEQEQTQVELRRKVNQLTALHKQIEELNVGLEAKVCERTAELERLNVALKSANEQLQELDRLKSEFFANISHEFRTPLTLSLGSFKELWKLSPTTRAREQINVGMRNTNRLLFLVNEFLDLAKFDRGALETKKLNIDMAALVRAVAANFESPERRRVHLRGANEPVPLEADPHQMKKVLYNLLANAIKFSDPAAGEVWIRLSSTGDRVELEVEDNGIGIPREQFGRIFERFAQVERRATRRQEGTGIGLALVKEIVTRHGGSITVESELGRGSTFTVSLPRGAATAGTMVAVEDEDAMSLPVFDQDTGKQAAPAAVAHASGGERPLVLVADDNADMRTYLERLLSARYRVVLARDGAEALEQAKLLHPDLILTDMMMPRMSGNELLKAVREDEGLRAIPVVFLTARAAAEARVESLAAGANDYIPKPFDELEILARVGNLIRLRAQERELVELQKEKMARFLPAQLAGVIFSDRADDVLKSHRAEITVVFIDLRGFTAFAEQAEPEDVMAVLRDYQAEMGRLVTAHRGTIERFSGDAIMIFFNDPVPIPNHAKQAVRLAVAMRGAMERLKHKWRQRGSDLGVGIGVATGYATLGLVGFEQRNDYAAIGAVTNLAARLCGEARHGQILISERVRNSVKDIVEVKSVGTLRLKGFQKPLPAYNVTGLAEPKPAGGNGKTKKRKRG
jgi:signal transduction histidine kinase/class 3 adenylate cyclase